MVEVYLHIGMPKTGSTEIQAYCARERDRLGQHGILYPRLEGEPRSHDALFRGMIHDRAEVDNASWQLVKGQVEAGRPDQVILSGEDLFFLDTSGIEHLRSLLCRHLRCSAIRMIAYLRRQDLWLESRYKHAVKAKSVRYAGSIEDFLAGSSEAAAVFDYEAIIERWTSTLAPSSLHIRPFERDQLNPKKHDGDLLADFLGTLGLSCHETPATDKGRRNVALERAPLEVVRAANRIDLSPEERRRVIRAAREVSRESQADGSAWPHPLLSPSRRREILAAAAPGNAAVARRWLGRPDGRLFLETLPVEDGDWRPYPGLTPDAIRSVMDRINGEVNPHPTGNASSTLASRVASAALGCSPDEGSNIRNSPHDRPAPGASMAARPSLTGNRARAILRGFQRAARVIMGKGS